MLTITPTPNYSVSFQAQTDYRKIYQEMEKITLKQEEKIIPKHKSHHSYFGKNMLKDISKWFKNILPKKHNKSRRYVSQPPKPKKEFEFDPIIHGFLPMIGIMGAISLGVLTLTAIASSAKSKNASTEIDKKAEETAIFLETSSNDTTISFDECRSKMNNAIQEYDKDSHITLFRTLTNTSPEMISDSCINQILRHNNQGDLFLSDREGQICDIVNCSRIHNQITLLNHKKDSLLNARLQSNNQ